MGKHLPEVVPDAAGRPLFSFRGNHRLRPGHYCSRKAVKKDAHRLTCRISARLETADYEALQRLIEAEGYATTQDWLTATVRRYIAEAGETE